MYSLFAIPRSRRTSPIPCRIRVLLQLLFRFGTSHESTGEIAVSFQPSASEGGSLVLWAGLLTRTPDGPKVSPNRRSRTGISGSRERSRIGLPVPHLRHSRARRIPPALSRVSWYSTPGWDIATMPPPTGNCSHPPAIVTVRMRMLRFIPPWKAIHPMLPQ
jgi:hypothetical protein